MYPFSKTLLLEKHLYIYLTFVFTSRKQKKTKGKYICVYIFEVAIFLQHTGVYVDR